MVGAGFIPARDRRFCMQVSMKATRVPSEQRPRRGHRPMKAASKVTLLMALAVLFLAPFFWLVVTALKTPEEMAAFPVHFWPNQLAWQNFVQAVTQVNFLAYAANSVILATINASLTTISSALVGFGFARLKGRGKRRLFL